MGKRNKREYNKEISSDEFIAAWNDPKNQQQIKTASRPYYPVIDNHIISSLQHEALWLALSNHNPDKSSFKTYLFLTTRYLIQQHCSSSYKKRAGKSTINIEIEEKEYRGHRHTYNYSEIDIIDHIDEIMTVLSRDCFSERDTEIFFKYLEGYKTEELGKKYGCTGKNISRIIISCRKALEKNANRTELPLSSSKKI
jgi:RNA polymerase sigma factor (sigma-70 family)